MGVGIPKGLLGYLKVGNFYFYKSVTSCCMPVFGACFSSMTI